MNTILERKPKKSNHVMEILIPFFGVFEPYKIGIVPFTAIMLLIIILFRGNGVLSLKKGTKPYVIFLAYMLFRDSMHVCFSVSVPINSQINRMLEYIVLYVLIFFVCSGDFDENALFRWWKIAGTIFGIGMLYHVFKLLVLNQNIHPISLIPGYDIAHDVDGLYSRPTSFFSEPAAYVTSMLPLLFLSLKRKIFIWAAISTFLIVVSTSTVGIVLTAVLWLLFIVFEKKSVKTVLLYVTFAIVFVILFLNLPIFSDALGKLEEVSSGESTWGSRIAGPFDMVKAMKWYELPFGTSILDTTKYVYGRINQFDSHSSVFKYVRQGRDVFFNTFAMLIYRYGIIGLCLFLYTFKGKIFDKKYRARIYAIAMLIAAFAQGSVADPATAMIVLLLYATHKEGELTN